MGRNQKIASATSFDYSISCKNYIGFFGILELKNKKKITFMKIRAIIIILIALLIAFVFYWVFIRGVGLYGTKIVYEDKSLGFFLNQYDKTLRIQIANTQPSDVTIGANVKGLEEKYDGQIVKWDLIVNESYDSFTDVVGNCYRVLQINSIDDQHLPINISFQGTNCKFWREIKNGDSISVVGEMNIEEWIVNEEKPYKTKVVNEIRPMVVKHNSSYYADTALLKHLRQQLLSTYE